MSSKTRSSSAPPPTGKPGKTKKPEPKSKSGVSEPWRELDSEFNMRFHKYFTNIMIPVLGILSLITLLPMLSGNMTQDTFFWIRLVYNSATIALCLVAFPGMRNMTIKGWKAGICLLILNAVYSVSMVVYYIAIEPDTTQGIIAAVSAAIFLLIVPYYKKRKKLFNI